MPNHVHPDPEPRPLVTLRHELAAHPLFAEDALVELLDVHPKELLVARTMGEDPTRPEEGRVALHDGLTGEELFAAVQQGRLWLDLTRLELTSQRFCELRRQLYDELGRRLDGAPPTPGHLTLSLASPCALAYYEVGVAPELRWQVRGHQRLWAYPGDERFVAAAVLEDVVAGVRRPQLPYDPRLDVHAKVVELGPGDAVSLPACTPRRAVCTGGVAVTLVGEHELGDSPRQARLLRANRFWRTTLGLHPGKATRGPRALAKVLVHGGALALGLDYQGRWCEVPSCRVDPSAPGGVASLDVGPTPVRLAVRELEDLDAVRPYAQAIDALNRESRRPCPFSTFDYLAALQRHDESGRPSRLCWLLAFSGNTLVGHLPLRHSEVLGLEGRSRKLELLSAGEADRPQLVARRRDEQRVRDAFMRHLSWKPSWDVLELWDQDERSPLRYVPEELRRRAYVRQIEGQPNTRIEVRWPTLADFGSELSKKFRQNLGRSVRRLLAAGEVELVVAEGAAAGPAFEHYLDIEARSWKHIAGGSVQRHPERLALFRELVGRGSPMPMQVHLVTLDGVPIAAMLAGTFAGTLYALQTCYEQVCADLGPGQLLLAALVWRAIELRLSAVNLLHGSSYYKERWLAEVTPSTCVQIIRHGTRLHARALLGELKRSAMQRLLERPTPPYNPVKRVAVTQVPMLTADVARRRAAFAELLARETTLTRLGRAQLSALLAAIVERPAQKQVARGVAVTSSQRAGA